MKLTKGQFLTITTGEYSDYGIRDYVRVLRDFDTAEVAKLFKETGPYLDVIEWAPNDDPSSYGSDDRFQAWAIREGYFAPVEAGEVAEWHIGSYGHFEAT